MKNRIRRLKFLLRYILKKKFRSQIAKALKESRYEAITNPDISSAKVLILERLTRTVGTFSDYIVFLHYIEKAIARDWLPIIDRKTSQNIVLSNYPDENTWEFFFEQPVMRSLDDIDYVHMKVQRCYTSDMNSVSLLRCKNDVIIHYWRSIAKQYIRFNLVTQEYLSRLENELLQSSRVLGVAVREGYSKTLQTDIKGHPIQVSTEHLLEETVKYLKDWNCEKVFITCETAETVELFQKRLGEMNVLYVQRNRNRNGDFAAVKLEVLEEYLKQRDQKEYELSYIAEVYLLSRCTSMICSETSGSEAAFIMSSGFEHFLCYDLGNY